MRNTFNTWSTTNNYVIGKKKTETKKKCFMMVCFGLYMFCFFPFKEFFLIQTEPCIPLQVFTLLVKQQKICGVITDFFFRLILY